MSAELLALHVEAHTSSSIIISVSISIHTARCNLFHLQDGWLEFNVPFQHKYGYGR